MVILSVGSPRCTETALRNHEEFRTAVEGSPGAADFAFVELIFNVASTRGLRLRWKFGLTGA